MSDQIELSTLLFTKPGPANTEACLKAASQRAGHLGIRDVVIASWSGGTVYKALEVFDPSRFNLIAVTHVTGFKKPDEQRMDDSVRRDLEQKGCRVLTCAHAFGGVGRGVRSKLNTYQVDEIMAFTLRMFGQGVKVGVEISLMAADAGMVRTDREIAAIGGTGSGADTAVITTPANSHTCLDLKVHEIICKPRL